MDDLRAFFETLALEWDSFQPPDRHEILNRLLSPFDDLLQRADSILEVGTGTGALIPLLAAHSPVSNLVSIDLATEMLARAHQRAPQTHLTQADAHALPFDTASFSAIVCHNSFPHFSQKATVLHEFRRVLRLGGWLLILHDLSRQRVNEVHQNARAEIIHQDLLPSGLELSQLLNQTGYATTCVEDDDTHYVVAATAREETI